ncbi:hypothetical protein [Aliiroseovarius sp.]|uniref:hypothetical protein n=1 Tax=Aliiroseovarius sp. TaxID=1872442 RepID=UPI003BAA92D6
MSVFFPNLSVLLAILIGGVLGMVVSGLVGTSLARKMVRRQEEMAREARNAREAEKQRQMEALRRAPSGRET